jgi:two-component system response regulator MprA
MACPRKLLLVDDDAEVLATLAELLSARCGAGCVVVAHDGAEALELVRRGLRPCRVVTDLQMPAMAGDELLTALAAEGFGDIPVITMTAALREGPAGAAAHLTKPFTVELLERALGATADDACRAARRAR